VLPALVVGAVNGWLVACVRPNSLIVTLGMLFVLRGLIYLYTGQRAIPDDVMFGSFYQIGNGRLWRTLPYPALAGAAVLALHLWVLQTRRFGRQVIAVGGSPEVARLAGHDVARVRFATFVPCALLTAVAGILMASAHGHVGLDGWTAYAGAKGAVMAMTRQLAVEFGPKGARVNSISPGTIATPMNVGIVAQMGERVARAFVKMQPIGRIGEPEEVAEAAVYPASDLAGFTTGHRPRASMAG
jgi:NAD(P)-dependent dehydrogenase (short-subunit alcohol dehydrogenase family)